MATYKINSCSLGQVITDANGTLTIDLHTASSGKVGMVTGSGATSYASYVYLYLPNKNVRFTFTTDLGPNAVENPTEQYLGMGNSVGAIPVMAFYLGADFSITGGVGQIKRYVSVGNKGYVIGKDTNLIYHRPFLSFDGYNAYRISGGAALTTDGNIYFGGVSVSTLYNRTGSQSSTAPFSPLVSGFVGSLLTASLNQYIPPSGGINVYTTTFNLTGNSNPPGATGAAPYYHDTPAGYITITIWSPPITTYYRDYSGFTITWETLADYALTSSTETTPYDNSYIIQSNNSFSLTFNRNTGVPFQQIIKPATNIRRGLPFAYSSSK